MGLRKYVNYEDILKQTIKVEATDLGDLHRKSPGVYFAAHKKDLIYRLVSDMNWKSRFKNKFLKYKDIKKQAIKAQITSKTDLKKKLAGAHRVAEKNNWFNRLSDELDWDTKIKGKWASFQSILDEAIRVNARSRSDFNNLSTGAYKAAWKAEYLEELAEILSWEEHTQTPSNAIYIWQACSAGHWNDKPIYKIGINTFEDGPKRIKDVAKSSGFNSKLILNVKVDGIKPKKLEKQLHSMFEKVLFDRKFDGSTEFRALSSADLEQACSLIESYAISISISKNLANC